MAKSYETVDQYIAQFSIDQQAVLSKIRQTIKDAVPEAKEKISYGIPTFTLSGNLVHFAAYDTHYAFYPGSQAITEFADELKPYSTSKGTIRFEPDQPIPYDLIKKITLKRALDHKKA